MRTLSVEFKKYNDGLKNMNIVYNKLYPFLPVNLFN